MRPRLLRFVAASIFLSLIVAPQWTVAGFPGRNARRIARTPPPAPPLADVSSERTNELLASSLPPVTPDDHALAEIVRIRDAHGSVLKGSLLEEPQPAEREPSRLPVEPRAEPSPRAKLADPFQTALRQVADVEARAPARPTTPATQELAADHPRADLTSPNHSVVVSLRAASRALDSKASDFEDARRFPDAERLRALAQQLRQEARALENADEPTRTP